MTRKPKKVESRLILASIEIIGILFLLVGLLHSSFSLVEPVKSISFTSEKLNYNEKEPGSFKVEKSAKWIEKGKARITFDVDTVLKTKNKNVDVIFVLDNSDSMRGNKLQRVKEDSIELIDSLLANSNNKVAIISFNTDSTILSDFTNDRDSLLNIINNLNNAGATNYYRALVNVDNLLRNYVQKQDKNCIVLFLTDGYPCVEIPNEETEYKMLKRQYPYLIINGIQYEMSSEILDPIKKVSDNQYLADMGTLNNVLFDASIDPIRYEKFIITDYIDTDNFMVESIDDIKVSQGKVDFNEGEQKVTWTIELLRSGISPSMTIDVVQKEDSKVKELVSTNKRENITVTMGEVEENIESVKTPILKDTYQVIYEGNAPSGCTVTNVPDSKNYSVLDKVAIEDQVPICGEYQFSKWEIVTPHVKRIHNGYFEMPENDVILRAEWKNLSLTKSMDGEVHEFKPQTLQKISENYAGELWEYKYYITKLVLQNKIQGVSGAIATFDISEEKTGGVMGYIVSNPSDTSTYTAYIQGDGKIIANSDSSYLFDGFRRLQTIEGLGYLDTSDVKNMSNMFAINSSSTLTGLDLSNLNTSNVIDMSGMFSGCTATSLSVSHFDTSNVTDMSGMFSGCRGLTSLEVNYFDTSNVTNMSNMFSGCGGLTSLDVSNFDTSKVTNMSGMFSVCGGLTSLNVSNFDTSNVTDISSMFSNCSLSSIDLSNFDTSKVTNLARMFSSCKNLTNLNISNFDTSKVTNMSDMFYSCEGLTSLYVSHFDTSNVTNLASMFSNCWRLTSLDVSNFNTSNVTDMSSMFSSCSGLTILDVSNFNTSSVSNMGSMFSGCWRLTSLNISGFETSKVTNMSYLFSKCSALTSLDVGNFNTSNVINMSYMFSSCSGLTSLNVSHFDTSKVTDMSSMFSECSSLTSLDLSSFEMFNVAKTRFMFDSCSNLTTAITISNPSTTDYNKMFNNAATNGSAKITVNYMESTSNLVDQMIATKSTGSNVVKGTKILGYNVTINGNNDIIPNVNQALPNQSVILSSASGNYMVTSFKMNESLVKGNSFIMPNTDVSITDIVVMKITIIESPHNPYPNSLNNKVYGEKTFEGATSLTVVLDYQTEGTFYDYIYLYDSSGTQYGKYGGYSRKTETIIIPGNYIKVVFSTDSSGNNYYGFKASIIPNYD